MAQNSPEVLITGPDLPLPDPIDIESITLHSELIEDPIAHKGREFDVLVFEPDQSLPFEIAEWLHYRAHTDDSVGTRNEGNKFRFDKIEDISSKFLRDNEGRTLLIAVDRETGYLSGASWTHQLQDNKKDFTLARACLEYFEKHELGRVRPQDFATIATQEYGNAHYTLAPHLKTLTVSRHFQQHPEHVGIVGRFGSNDTIVLDLEVDVDKEQDFQFRPIKSGPGFLILLAIRQEPTDENPLKQT